MIYSSSIDVKPAGFVADYLRKGKSIFLIYVRVWAWFKAKGVPLKIQDNTPYTMLYYVTSK